MYQAMENAPRGSAHLIDQVAQVVRKFADARDNLVKADALRATASFHDGNTSHIFLGAEKCGKKFKKSPLHAKMPKSEVRSSLFIFIPVQSIK